MSDELILVAAKTIAAAKSAIEAAEAALIAVIQTGEPPNRVGTGDPATCQHPKLFELATGSGTTYMCESCGQADVEPGT